ncbi:MAG: HAMP domain-containing protein [Acidobacteria bacterium]|nr:HAMP domain-containing protein [Acidobacteriota bacterium]
MSQIDTTTLATLMGSLACLVLFLAALRGRWLARLRNGYLITLMLALAGAGFVSALLVGVWDYEGAQKIVHAGIVTDLQNIGQIVEQQIQRDIDAAFGLMETLAGDTGRGIELNALAQARSELQEARTLNPRLLQIRVFDAESKVLLEAGTAGQLEPPNRVATAFALEGTAFASDPYFSPAFNRYVLTLSVPIRSAAGGLIGSLNSRYDIQSAFLELTGASRFNLSGYAVLVNHDGRILGHPNAGRIHDDISSYEAVKLGLAGQTGSLQAVNKAGEERLMFYRPVKSPATVNPKPMVLLSEILEEEAEAPVQALRRQLFLAMAIILFTSLAIAQQVARTLKKPIQDVVHTVQRVGSGDLTVEPLAESRDEMGQLSSAVNVMVDGLRERERVKEVFGQYVATQVSEKVLKGEVNLGGESRVVTILFSDIRGFTSMAEEMTPTQVVAFLNDYFSEMVEAVFEQGGVLDKFIGDGMMAVFGAFGETPDHARRAVRAALRMKALLSKINGERSTTGKPPISIGIGIHTDEVILGNIGTRKRLQYTAIGDGVNTCSRVQALNKEFGTTILITETTYAQVKDAFVCKHMPEAQLRGKTKPLQFYEVLSAKEA